MAMSKLERQGNYICSGHNSKHQCKSFCNPVLKPIIWQFAGVLLCNSRAKFEHDKLAINDDINRKICAFYKRQVHNSCFIPFIFHSYRYIAKPTYWKEQTTFTPFSDIYVLNFWDRLRSTSYHRSRQCSILVSEQPS